MKRVGCYWGYLLLLLALTAWWAIEIGPVVLIILPGVTVGCFCFRVPSGVVRLPGKVERVARTLVVCCLAAAIASTNGKSSR